MKPEHQILLEIDADGTINVTATYQTPAEAIQILQRAAMEVKLRAIENGTLDIKDVGKFELEEYRNSPDLKAWVQFYSHGNGLMMDNGGTNSEIASLILNAMLGNKGIAACVDVAKKHYDKMVKV